MNTKQMAYDNLIFKIITGSHLYGTNTEKSDIDYFGVCIPPEDFVLGIYKFEQYEERTNPSNSEIKNNPDDVDFTIYSLPKYFKLLMDGNPNILETLFAPEKSFLHHSVLGNEIYANKHIFLSKKAYHKFKGYAEAQKRKVLTKTPIGLRTQIVKKHGFDVKFAMHCIRLLLFGIELLETGGLKLPTDNKQYLMSIRNGEWQLQNIVEEALKLEKRLDEAFAFSTKLPEKPDVEAINKLQIKLFKEHWRK